MYFSNGIKSSCNQIHLFSKGWLDPNYILLYFLEIAPQRKLIAKIRLPIDTLELSILHAYFIPQTRSIIFERGVGADSSKKKS